MSPDPLGLDRSQKKLPSGSSAKRTRSSQTANSPMTVLFYSKNSSDPFSIELLDERKPAIQ